MAHELDITDGQTSFVSARESAWHQLGTVLPDTFTAEEAMTHGLLGGWDVRKVPMMFPDSNGELQTVPGKNAVVRDNPVNGATDLLGVVGNGYQIIQNEEHAALLNALVDESGAHFETAGSLNGGSRVFITMKLPGHMLIGGVDQVETNIAAINSHDGSMSFSLITTPVRVVCANTLRAAFNGANSVYKIRHSSGAKRNMEEARTALDLTFNYLDGFQADAERMIQQTLTDARFEQILFEEFGPAEGAALNTVTRSQNKIDTMMSLFCYADTQDNIRNTVWAGFNAITEWADHFAPVRGDDRANTRAAQAVLTDGFKNRILDKMLALT